jgi:hypothetical protein
MNPNPSNSRKGQSVREYSKSRVAVKDLEIHDTVFLAGPEVAQHEGVFSLHFMGESDTLSGEILEALESQQPGKIRIRIQTPKFAYLLDVERSQEFLTVSPNLSTAGDLAIGDSIILRGEAEPESLGGKESHTELVKARGAIAEVRKVKTLRDGCKKITVLIAQRKKFSFIVEPERVLEIV